MPNIKIQREAIYKDFSATPGPCPKCGSTLEQTSLPYMVATHTGRRLGDSFIISGDFGWFCQACPVVVLKQSEVHEMMSFSNPGWEIGSEFTVLGIMDLDAIPENKRNLPIGSPEMPNLLVKFRNLEGEKPASRKRHKKTRGKTS